MPGFSGSSSRGSSPGDPSFTSISGPTDAFGVVQAAPPVQLFDAKFDVEDELGLTWFEDVSAAGATSTHDANAGTLTLKVGDGSDTADGDRAIRKGRATPYIPGEGKEFKITFCFGEATASANVEKRYGLFDDEDGIFIFQDSSGVSLTVRDSTSGSVVETNTVAQSAWDDPGDGTGKSRVTIDWTKRQLFVFKVAWLGVGDVEVWMESGGGFHLMHTFKHANATNGNPYMATAVLPISAEIKANGAIVSSGTGGAGLTIICSTVQVYGSSKGLVQPEIGSNRVTARTAATGGTPIVSMRASHARVPLEPLAVHVLNTSGTRPVFWELVFNGALTGANFIAATGDEHHDLDIAATAITGGKKVVSGYLPAGGGGGDAVGEGVTSTRVRLGVDIDGTTFDHLSLVVYGIGGTAACHGTIECISYHG